MAAAAPALLGAWLRLPPVVGFVCGCMASGGVGPFAVVAPDESDEFGASADAAAVGVGALFGGVLRRKVLLLRLRKTDLFGVLDAPLAAAAAVLLQSVVLLLLVVVAIVGCFVAAPLPLESSRVATAN